MTRRNPSNSYFAQIGSFAKNLKRMAVVSALLFSGETAATEAHYNVRIHKNFIKDVMDKNFQVLLSHVEAKVSKDVYLTDIDLAIDNLELRIHPKKDESGRSDWHDIKSDLFFDQGQIVMELSEL